MACVNSRAHFSRLLPKAAADLAGWLFSSYRLHDYPLLHALFLSAPAQGLPSMLAALSARRVLPAKSVLASSLHSARRRATGAVTRNYTAMASSTAPSWSDWRLNPPCAIPSTSQTLAHHDQLPRLPVPDIQATREKILNSAKPLAKDEKEFEEMKRQLDEFLSSPLAKELNNALVARSKDP